MGLGPAAWFRNQQGITQAGGFVSQWDDQSGNGRHLLQATGTNQPSLQADGSILFDGVDNFLKCAAFTLNQPETVYILVNQVTWTGNDIIFDGDADGGGQLFQRTVTPTIALFAGTSSANNTGLAVGTYGAVVAVFNGASSLLQVNNGTPSTGDAGANNLSGFTLGSNGVTFSNIQVKEAILFPSAHSATTRAQVIQYLATVGGISV